jgi:hypothetical protein
VSKEGGRHELVSNPLDGGPDPNQHGEKYAVMDARARFARALTADGLISPEVAKPKLAIRAIRSRAMRAASRLRALA